MSEEHELDQEAWALQEAAAADEAERERWAGRLRKVAARWRAEGNPLAVELEAVIEQLGSAGYWAWRRRQACPRCAGAVPSCPECHGVSAPPQEAARGRSQEG